MGGQVGLDEIEGCFVVEVGERQAWPFLTFCDNRGRSSREARLCLDSSWSVNDSEGRVAVSDAVDSLCQLNGLTVDRACVSDGGDLEVTLEARYRLIVSGKGNAQTVAEPWWFSPWAS